jgi:hypothetical protein
MDKQAVQEQFNSFLEHYPKRSIESLYSKDDLLNFYLQGRIDANNEILKQIKS